MTCMTHENRSIWFPCVNIGSLCYSATGRGDGWFSEKLCQEYFRACKICNLSFSGTCTPLCQFSHPPGVDGISILSTYFPKHGNLLDFDIGLLFIIWCHKVAVFTVSSELLWLFFLFRYLFLLALWFYIYSENESFVSFSLYFYFLGLWYRDVSDVIQVVISPLWLVVFLIFRNFLKKTFFLIY